MSRKPSRSRKIALRAPGWKELIILRLCASNNIMRLIIILFLSLVSSLSAERLIEDHFLISMQSQAMGTYTRIMDRDESTGEIETRVEMQIRIKRFKEPVVISRTSIVREDKSGRPIAFDIISNESQIPAKTHGMRVGDEFVVTTESAGEIKETRVAAPEEAIGPRAADLLQQQKGFSPGTSYEYEVFSPDSADDLVNDYNVEVIGTSKFKTPRGEVDVSVVKSHPLPGGPAETSLVGKDGTIYSLELESAGFKMTRATREEAAATQFNADVADLFFIPVEGSIDRPRASKQSRFEISSSKGVPMIASVAYQQSEKKGDKLIVTQKVPLLPRGARAPAPDAKDPNRLPDRYVNSDDPEIIKLAAKIVGKETDISRKVMLMNSWVFRHIEKKNFSVGYASASEVVRNLEGDCTEHSVLFAALARSQGIPTRLALGVVYMEMEGKPSFLFHQWNEVYVGGQWIPVDPTFGEAPADASRVLIGYNSESRESSQRPGIDWAGQVRIRILGPGE